MNNRDYYCAYCEYCGYYGDCFICDNPASENYGRIVWLSECCTEYEPEKKGGGECEV